MDLLVRECINPTEAINEAISTVSVSGGGRVVIKPGLYRVGTIILKSDVSLFLDEGAILKASDNLSDFGDEKIKALEKPTYENCDYSGDPKLHFIYARDAKNVFIEGFGTIDGNEEIFYGKVSEHHIDGYFYPRMPLIFMENVTNVHIKGVTLQKSAFWTTHLVGCKNVLIEGVTINNSRIFANSDGIDPDHCSNVIIHDCNISAADDCIVFKTTEAKRTYGACRDIEVYNCNLKSTSAAIKIGTESVSDFENIYVHDCKIEDSNRGIALQLRDEGNINNIRFENIEIETHRFSPLYWWGKAEPISITAVRRKRISSLGQIRNVTFKNIKADSENGIFIYGMEDSISDLVFNDISLNIKSKTSWEKTIHDVRPCEEVGMIDEPMSALCIRNAKNIVFKHFSFKINRNIKEYFGNAIDLKNTENILVK